MNERQKRSWNDITNAVGLPTEETETFIDAEVLPINDPEATRTVLSTAQNPLVKTGVVFAGVALILGGVGTFFYLSQPGNPDVASKPTATVPPQNTQIVDLETENSKLKADKAFGLTPTGNGNPPTISSTVTSSPAPANGSQAIAPPVIPKNPAPVQSVAVAPVVTPPKVAPPVITPSRATNPVALVKPVVVAKQIAQAPTVSQRDKDIATAINGNSNQRKPDLPIASTVLQSRISPSNNIPPKPTNPPTKVAPIAKTPLVSPKDRDIATAITAKQKPEIAVASAPSKPIATPKIIAPAPIASVPASASAPSPVPVDWKTVSTSGTYGGRYDRNPGTGNNLASDQIAKAVTPEKQTIGEIAEVPVIPAVLPTPVVQQIASNIPAAPPPPVVQQVSSNIPTALPPPVIQQVASNIPAALPPPVVQQVVSNIPAALPPPVVQQVASNIPTALPPPLPAPINNFADNGDRLQTSTSPLNNNKAVDGKVKIEPLNTVTSSNDEAAVINASTGSLPQTTEQSIQPGQVLKASLATPLQLLSEDNTSKPILLNINSPIVDLNGRIAIPSGAQVAGTFVTSNNGFIQLKTEKLVYQGKEITLPDNLFAIQSENGEPLLARSIQPGIGEASALAKETGLYGAAQRVGQVLTAPDTNSTISSSAGGVFGSSSSQNNRNIFGAVVEGFSNPIVQQQQQRSNAEIARISGQQRIVYLPIGHKFSLVIARTFKTR
jgi:hypothetical protein